MRHYCLARAPGHVKLTDFGLSKEGIQDHGDAGMHHNASSAHLSVGTSDSSFWSIAFLPQLIMQLHSGEGRMHPKYPTTTLKHPIVQLPATLLLHISYITQDNFSARSMCGPGTQRRQWTKLALFGWGGSSKQWVNWIRAMLHNVGRFGVLWSRAYECVSLRTAQVHQSTWHQRF